MANRPCQGFSVSDGANVLTKYLNLALQGGGAHGAFTWGALDCILDDPEIEFEAITATSAGAMNAAMLVTGLANGGRAGAKAMLEEFWNKVVERAVGPRSALNMFALPPHPAVMRSFYENSPAYQFGELVTRTFSPYQLNPLNINPLRDLLEELIDFDCLCSSDFPRLFINATNVRKGRAHVFQGDDITVDAILASACLPHLFQAVEIDGEAYWDGGYMGNPAIYPLVYGAETRDVLIVHINPIIRDELPITSQEIDNRINELSFNASLMREMRAVSFVQRLLDDGALDRDQYKRLRIHSVRDDDTMSAFGVATKATPDWTVLQQLRNAGHRAMRAWLEAHKDKIGVSDSVDIRKEFL